jgi:glycerol-3-phosphate dehydrogenase (NAD(P)+)
MKVSVIGAGSWGTALAFLLADAGHRVRLWAYETEVVEAIRTRRENTVFLPGIKLPAAIDPTNSFEEAMEGTGLLVFVVPSHVTRKVLSGLAPHIPSGIPIVSATKGIENETLLLMTDVMKEALPPSNHPYITVLSGPSFAKEVVRRQPTAVSMASADHALAVKVQAAMSTPYFKIFITNDLIGVQLGGALKNVIAVAAGGADGLGFGHNTRSALITRGLAEIMRLGRAMGADPRTFAGLSGLGDLILTSTGELSRNRQVGYQIGQGHSLDEILKEMRMVAEGVHTARAAHRLAQKMGVRMPIVQQVYAVLFDGKDPHRAVTDLMEGVGGDEVEDAGRWLG